MNIVFRQATVVSSRGKEVRDVFVSEGKISAPLEFIEREIDARGKFLMPGMIDGHVHFREPGGSYKETWETGSRAAAMGGVTTVLDMPNTNPPTITVAALDEKRALVRGRSYTNYGFHFGTTGDNFAELEKVEGVTGFKIYIGSSTGNLLVDQPEIWEKIFRIAHARRIPVIVHAENEAMIQAGERGCECARIATETALQLREKVGNKLHIAHLSCANELELIKKYKNSLLTCEVTPHHLYFSKDDIQDGHLRINPPLRSLDNLVRLWEGLRQGIITTVATDHAPHSIEEKSQSYDAAPAGVPGVEFVLPLLLNEVNGNMLSWEDLVRSCCEAPAKLFGLPNKGALEEGMDADLVLVDMEMEKKIERRMVQSKCGWSPYEGFTLKGWPVLTVVNGEVVMENGQFFKPVGNEVSPRF